MRFIVLDENNKVVDVEYTNAKIKGKIQSDEGEIGQILQPDGTFVDDPDSNAKIDQIMTTLDLVLLKQEGIL